jgi:hypothetical protein
MNIIIFTIIKSIIIKNIIFCVINKYFITRGTWAPVTLLGHPSSHVTLSLLPLCWVHPFAHVALGLSAWGLGTPQLARSVWARQDPTILGPRMLQNSK